MRCKMIAVFILVCMAVSGADAAEKSKSQAQIDSVRVMIEAATARAGDNKAAAADLEQARALLQKAGTALEKGRALFGFGDVKPEAEQEIRHYAGMAELAVSLADSRIGKTRAETELGPLDKQLATVKARLKVFEDRKAEQEKLKADAAKYQAAAKELEALKADKALLASQLEMLLAERGQADKLKGEQVEVTRKLEELKAENSRLKEQVERLQAERKAMPAQPAEAGKAALKPAKAPTVPDAKDTPGKGDAAPAMPPEKE